MAIIFVALCSWSIPAHAQISCSQVLKEAQKNYEQGVLEQIPSSLKNCMLSYTKTEKIAALRLIILTYLFLDEMDQAKSNMKSLVNMEPDYKPDPALDPAEYINLFNDFAVIPKYLIGVNAGTIYTMPTLVNDYTLGSNPSESTKYSNSAFFQGGISLEYGLSKKFFLGLDVHLNLQNFASTRNVYAQSTLEAQETLISTETPLTFKYLLGSKNLKYYLRVGIAPSHVVSSTIEMTRKSPTGDDVKSSVVDNVSNRNPLNFYLQAGGGVTYKVGYGYLFCDLRYAHGLTNISNPDNRYAFKNFETQITNYGYIENDLYLRNVMVSFGYMYSFYKVKSLKK